MPVVEAKRGRGLTPRPKGFFKAHVHDMGRSTSFVALCAGYESEAWRTQGFAEYLMDYLIEFALTRDEWPNVNTATAFRSLRQAARSVYTTKKSATRGEIGELLLHAVMREHYGSEPLVSKFYFKSAANDTVKGFDAAHIMLTGTGVELWLGEVKFYTEVARAIRDVVKELDAHLEDQYLREEFMWLSRKVPENTPELENVMRLLDEATTLDEIVEVIHVPVLLTYESPVVAAHNRTTDAYVKAFEAEVEAHYRAFTSRNKQRRVVVHLCLVPLHNKEALITKFDTLLKGQQGLG
ncbi:DUF1837 domain-containing protein [Azospirillum sp. TSH64]|uniref:HamA C-terminal domain-containing protein n=1 Tax=Azospirillum sp. TSH64 TaxID=652740 RepID=UPI001304F4FE|nr:DUF1837 domain-containing protein [Azospirillum sp. TSH64]